MRAMLVAAMLFALGVADTQAQQMYRWTDKDGRVHYTQHPPPPEAKNVQRRSGGTSVVESTEVPYATQVAAKNFPVTIYTSPDCGPPCKDGRDALDKRGIPYSEVMVGDEKSIEELRRIAGRTEVPLLRVGKQVEVGFQAEAWKSALDAAGYPAIGTPIRPRSQPTAAAKPLPSVKLYVRADCGDLCDGARKVLVDRKVNFQEIDVSPSVPESVEELMKVAGAAVVPVLVIGDRAQRGFDPGLYDGLLDAAGFPRIPASPTGTGSVPAAR